ncbi:MAG: transporter related [Flavipsychrobacter sp.]|jgi:ABC-type polysaccharide/polyol phosphate transport system ATPase subunit|nr:transporter related [Flavipsychrobacter sp.]
MSNDLIIKVDNVHVSFWQNNLGIYTLKDLIAQRKLPFKSKTILNNISVEVKRGDSLGIVGRNGSGKSTLLRTIAGIIKPDRGTVIVNGTFAPILAIGAGLESELTGYENIKLLLALYGTARKNTNAIDNVREFSELSDDVLRSPVKQYSSGMLARLAFSISLANDSDILIIDEVMAVGDQGFQGKCVKKIYDMKEQGKTILYVSHFPDDVARICNKAVLLEGGEVVHSGDSQEICQKYSNLF